MQYVRWYEWGDAISAKSSLSRAMRRGHLAIDEIIVDENHADIGLTDDEYRRLVLGAT